MRTSTVQLLLISLAAATLTGCCPPQTVQPGSQPKAAPAAPKAPAMAAPEAPRTPAAPSAPAAEEAPAGMGRITAILPVNPDGGGTVKLVKTAPREILVGREFDYTLALTNLTADTLRDVTLTAKLPAGFQPSATRPEAQMDPQTASWKIAAFGPGETKTFAVRGAATEVGEMLACSDVTFTVPSACLPIRAVQPIVKIEKTAPAEVLLCDEIPITILVSNTGTGPAENVVVRDALPEGLVLVDGRREITEPIGTLRPGEAKKITLRTKPERNGEFATTATVTADGGIQASSSTKTVVRRPALAMTMEAPRERLVGLKVPYEVTITNNGDGDALDTVLVLQLPTNAAFVSAAGAQPQAGRLSWSLGTVRPGESKKASVVLNASEIGTLTASASATAKCSVASARTETTVKGIPAILLECVDSPDPIEVGEGTTYTITVTNQGSAVGTNIVITCTLPDEQDLVKAEGPTKATTEGKTVTFTPLATLAPKARAVYTVTVKAIAAGDVRFKTSLTSDQMTSPAMETEATHQYQE